MGKLQKIVWPKGKNLKPLPKGRARQQPIPTAQQMQQDRQARVTRLREAMLLPAALLETPAPMTVTEMRLRQEEWMREPTPSRS